MIENNDIKPQEGQWYRDQSYTMEQWGWEARNGDDPPDYLLWVLQKYEDDQIEAPASLIEEIERIGGAVQDGDIYANVPEKFRSLYPVEDWQCEAENNDTRLGYRAWLAHRLEADNEWQEVANRPGQARQQPLGPRVRNQ